MLAATRDFTLEVNASRHTVTADPDTPLLYILRNDLCLNGPKFGCGLGECGACAVLIDGVAARACTIPVRGAAGHAITTLEGLGTPQAPGPVQQAAAPISKSWRRCAARRACGPRDRHEPRRPA
ncbi:(2Fe-2S)-binding protein, partial [Bordetella pertussis]|uniref:(2Fe-2S)-binding protein n=1 Tax=Bordetella pertussis TaxID=520 RepID=UPI0021CC45D3